MHSRQDSKSSSLSAARLLIAPALGAMGIFFAGIAVASCGSSAGAAFTCADTYGSLCGKVCASDAECDLGLHCSSGACGASCSPAAGCSSGEICSPSGTCTQPTGGLTGTPCSGATGLCPAGFLCNGTTCQPGCSSSQSCPSGTVCMSSGACAPEGAIIPTDVDGSTGGNFEGDGCVNLTVGFEGKTPTVMLLVDQSGSMSDAFPAGKSTTRWSVLRSALMDPMTGAVKQMESTVRMGLAMYTSNHGTAGGTCPMLTQVGINANNYSAIDAVYQMSKPLGDTPTGESISAVAQELAGQPDPKYILLVTDGLPDTCADPDAGNSPARQNAANASTVKAAQAAHAQGIGLFVMGVSSDIAPSHLQAMANAGAGLDPATAPPAAAKYYVASDNQTDLAAQLSGIIGSTRTCTFHLQGTVDTGHAGEGIVTLGGATLGYNDPNGFRLNGPSDLEILGTACNKIKNENTELVVRFPCDVVHLIR
jgi:hypothetical protein